MKLLIKIKNYLIKIKPLTIRDAFNTSSLLAIFLFPPNIPGAFFEDMHPFCRNSKNGHLAMVLNHFHRPGKAFYLTFYKNWLFFKNEFSYFEEKKFFYYYIYIYMYEYV